MKQPNEIKMIVLGSYTMLKDMFKLPVSGKIVSRSQNGKNVLDTGTHLADGEIYDTVPDTDCGRLLEKKFLAGEPVAKKECENARMEIKREPAKRTRAKTTKSAAVADCPY